LGAMVNWGLIANPFGGASGYVSACGGRRRRRLGNTVVTAVQTTLTTDTEQTLPGRQSSPSVGRAVIRLSDN